MIIYSAFKFNGFLIIYCGGSVYKKLGFSIRLPSHIIIEMIAGLYLPTRYKFSTVVKKTSI